MRKVINAVIHTVYPQKNTEWLFIMTNVITGFMI